jgi:hypothetical protein
MLEWPPYLTAETFDESESLTRGIAGREQQTVLRMDQRTVDRGRRVMKRRLNDMVGSP